MLICRMYTLSNLQPPSPASHHFLGWRPHVTRFLTLDDDGDDDDGDCQDYDGDFLMLDHAKGFVAVRGFDEMQLSWFLTREPYKDY